jgi:hypothetical protein
MTNTAKPVSAVAALSESLNSPNFCINLKPSLSFSSSSFFNMSNFNNERRFFNYPEPQEG